MAWSSFSRCLRSAAWAPATLALIYFMQGHDDLAWQALQDTGEIWSAMFNLGVAHMARGKHRAAAAAFAATSQAQPNWAEPRYRAKQARTEMMTAPKPRCNFGEPPHGDC